jgi:thiazole tautomerase (transcriptional regulator TenI)
VIAAPAVMLVTSRRRLAPEARTAAHELEALAGWLDEAIDARVDVAAAAGAAGVQLPARGLPPARVRAAHPDWAIGLSVHDGYDMTRRGPDWLVFGTVFPSQSKPGGGSAGLAALERAAAAAPCPVLAIGGVTAERAERCAASGAAGIAAIGLFLPPGRSPEARGLRIVPDVRAALARGAAVRRDGQRHLVE